MTAARRRRCGKGSERIKLMKEHWGWKPHPSQRIWLMEEADVKVAACGRRWGKTEAASYDAAAFAIQNPGSVQMIVSPTYDQSRLIFGTVERLIFGNEALKVDAKCVKTPYPHLTLGNGSVLMARTADEDGRNLRGHSADRVIVDEAAFVRDVVVEEVISPMLADRNGKMILISTPFGRNHFYRSFIRGEDRGSKRYRSFGFPSWENPHISHEYIESQREVITERQFAVEYEAQFLDDQNAVFKWDDIQSAVNLTTKRKGEQYLVAGVDWARYSDYTAIVVIDAWSDPQEVIEIDRFNLISWERQLERLSSMVKRLGIKSILMDQTSIGDPLLEMMQGKIREMGERVRVEGVNFSNNSKRELMDRLGMQLSYRNLAIPNNEQLIKELHYYEYELTSSGNMRMNAKRGYNDDLVCALALAVQAGKDCRRAITVASVPRQREEGVF